jgi:hypothetical protein
MVNENSPLVLPTLQNFAIAGIAVTTKIMRLVATMTRGRRIFIGLVLSPIFANLALFGQEAFTEAGYPAINP